MIAPRSPFSGDPRAGTGRKAVFLPFVLILKHKKHPLRFGQGLAIMEKNEKG